MALYFPITYQANDIIPYNISMCNSDLSLTPTTPSTINNQFFVPPPFEPFSYSQSPNNHCQVSPLQLSPIHEFSECSNASNNSKHSNEDNCYGKNYNTFSFECNDIQQNQLQDVYYSNSMNPLNAYNSVVDTPDSVYGSANDNYFDNDNNFFKFEPEDIARINSTQFSQMDNEYINYNEINCQSKNQSPCGSPTHIDPWIANNLNYVGSQSPKVEDNHLPPINQAFSTHFHSTIEDTKTNVANLSLEHNLLDSFDTIFLDEFFEPKMGTELHINPENYNMSSVNEDKPNREYKDIWTEPKKPLNILLPADIQKSSNMPKIPKINIINANKLKPLKPKSLPKTKAVEDENDGEEDREPKECKWQNCNKIFSGKMELVAHIEKTHVVCKKGDEFTCYWHECMRSSRPFNARYKLLIHMRIHSLDKPNKCPVSFFFIFI